MAQSTPAGRSPPLFSFGTLQDPEVFALVSGGVALHSVAKAPGRLEGYRVCGVLDGLYPVLRQEPGAAAPGTVFYDLPEAVQARLEWFEWPEFVPDRLEVVTDTGPLACTCFLPAKAPAASDAPWSLERWATGRKAAWIDHAALAMSFYGVCAATELEAHWDAILAFLAGETVVLPTHIEARCRTLGERD